MARLLDTLTDKLRALSEEDLQRVLQFIESLRGQQMPRPQQGSAEVLLAHAGAWAFAPGELESLLADLECLRQLELET